MGSYSPHEFLWLRRLLNDCEVHKAPTKLLIDNKSVIHVANNSYTTKRRKLIDISHHYLAYTVLKGNITVCYVSTHTNTAHMMTKVLVHIKPARLTKIHMITTAPIDLTSTSCHNLKTIPVNKPTS